MLIISKLIRSINIKLIRLSSVGVKNAYDKGLTAKIVLSNRIMLICIALTLPFLFGFYFLGYPSLGFGILALCSAYASCLILHRNCHHNSAFFLTWFLPICGILIYFSATGKPAGFHYILFFSASLGTILFNREKKSLVITSMVFPIVLFFICDFFGDRFVFVSLFDSTILASLRLLAMVITIVCILSVVTIYINQTVRLLKHKQNKEDLVKFKLKILKDDIESKNKLIDSFESDKAFISATTGVAHEIRSPMASLLAGAELLRDNVEDPVAVKEFSELLISTIQRLKVFTQSILSFGANTSENKVQFDISQLVTELSALMTYQTNRLGIKLSVSQPKACVITANREYIGQALLNLIVNATQHTPKRGKISVKLEEINDLLNISISDTGSGIKKEHLPLIFSANNSSKKDVYNAGLGLVLVKRVIDDHNGKIEVSSEINLGTTFKIQLPLNV
jgi:signal transduction histidine kinase